MFKQIIVAMVVLAAMGSVSGGSGQVAERVTIARSIHCPRCGSDNPDGAKFCRSCGRELPRRTEALPPSQPDTARAVAERPPEAASSTPVQLGELSREELLALVTALSIRVEVLEARADDSVRVSNMTRAELEKLVRKMAAEKHKHPGGFSGFLTVIGGITLTVMFLGLIL